MFIIGYKMGIPWNIIISYNIIIYLVLSLRLMDLVSCRLPIHFAADFVSSAWDDPQALHARDGTDRMWVNVVSPSFATDCITLYILYIYIYIILYI